MKHVKLSINMALVTSIILGFIFTLATIKPVFADETCQAACELAYKKCIKGKEDDIDAITKCADDKSTCINGC